MIAKIERVVRYRETLAVAMPRGSGNTSICMVAVLWAVLSGQRCSSHPFNPDSRRHAVCRPRLEGDGVVQGVGGLDV